MAKKKILPVNKEALSKLNKEKEANEKQQTKTTASTPPDDGKAMREKPGRKLTVPKSFVKTGIQINPDHDTKIKMLILQGVFSSRDKVIDNALKAYLKDY